MTFWLYVQHHHKKIDHSCMSLKFVFARFVDSLVAVKLVALTKWHVYEFLCVRFLTSKLMLPQCSCEDSWLSGVVSWVRYVVSDIHVFKIQVQRWIIGKNILDRNTICKKNVNNLNVSKIPCVKFSISDFHVCRVSIVISDLFSSILLPTPHQQYSNYGIQIGIRF